MNLSPTPSDAAAQAFKLGMRRLASGVSVITTVVDGQPHGLVATSVASVAAEPATLLVCVNRSTSSHDLISRSGRFCVNVMRHEDHELVAPFGSRSRSAERFSAGTWRTTPNGTQALASAIASFDCEVEQEVQSHSHTIFIGRVQHVNLGPDGAPLVYFNQAYATLGGCPAANPSPVSQGVPS